MDKSWHFTARSKVQENTKTLTKAANGGKGRRKQKIEITLIYTLVNEK